MERRGIGGWGAYYLAARVLLSLSGITQSQAIPMGVWESSNLAARSPTEVSNTRCWKLPSIPLLFSS